MSSHRPAAAIAAVALVLASGQSRAQTTPTHRIPLALAIEAASEAVAACAKQGYNETVIVVDADGVRQVELRADGAGAHTLDSANDKAFTAASFKNDTLALAERAKTTDLGTLQKLPHVMFFGGGVVIKMGNEVVGAIGASGAPGAQLDNGCAHAGLEKISDRLK